MALKDLLVYADYGADTSLRLRLAMDLAVRHGAQVTVAYAHEPSEAQIEGRRAAEIGLVSGAELARFDQRVERSIDDISERLRGELTDMARERGLEVRWLTLEGPASIHLPQLARYADLCIVGHSVAADEDPNTYSFSEALLFTAGRPVLSVPGGWRGETLGAHIAVGWNSSRASARSVCDALALIERADRTTIITVNPSGYLNRPGVQPAGRLVEHFARHGVEAPLIEVQQDGTASIGDALQAQAIAAGADLLVAGAFGHPRLWERLLGGGTRDLLDRMQLPIMMSA